MEEMKKWMVLGIGVLLLMGSCVEDFIGGDGVQGCMQELSPDTSLPELLDLYQGEPLALEAHQIKVQVVSSDREGNHFGVLVVQDGDRGPGLQILLDMQDSHLQYPPGTWILLTTEGLYLDKTNSGYKLGTAMPVFGTLSLGRIPSRKTGEYLKPACGAPAEVVPKEVTIEELKDSMINTLLRISAVQIITDGNPATLGSEEEDTRQVLENCEGATVELHIGKFTDFNMDPIPDGKGSVTGILKKDGKSYVIHPSTRTEIDLLAPRCSSGPGDPEDVPVEEEPEGTIAMPVLISEIADPDNAPEARFIELYNAGSEEVSLQGWKLLRYTNANTEAGAATVLDDLSISPGGVLVIAAEAEGFASVYGKPAGMVGGKNSAAGSNGDDNIVLIDPEGEIRDIFGRIGEDGSGTDHEFEDGRALRKEGVMQPNPVFDPLEWSIFNDTGAEGTIKEVKIAPGDFSPGSH